MSVYCCNKLCKLSFLSLATFFMEFEKHQNGNKYMQIRLWMYFCTTMLTNHYITQSIKANCYDNNFVVIIIDQ